jgi:hypothetical protein
VRLANAEGPFGHKHLLSRAILCEGCPFVEGGRGAVRAPVCTMGLFAAFIEPTVRIFMICIRNMSKKYCNNIFGLNPLTIGHAGRFSSGWG